jgi:hypothetical protein
VAQVEDLLGSLHLVLRPEDLALLDTASRV